MTGLALVGAGLRPGVAALEPPSPTRDRFAPSGARHDRAAWRAFAQAALGLPA